MSDAKNTAASHDYKADPNYYRLAYQLVAQEANQATLSVEAEAELHPKVTAEKLAVDMDETLNALDGRQRRARFLPRRGLNGAQLRLQRFLAGTIEPCTLLILAAGDAHENEDPSDYVRRRRPPRMSVKYSRFLRASSEAEIPWSYRAYYNLACSRAELVRLRRTGDALMSPREVDPSRLLTLSLDALCEAFRRVDGAPRAELWRWASKDPSLSQLRDSPSVGARFARLLEEYKPAGASGNAPSAP